MDDKYLNHTIMNTVFFFISISIFTYNCSFSQKSMIKDNISSEGCPENVSIKLGQSYTVKLPAIEGTGYLWIPTPSALIAWDEEEKYEKVIVDSNTTEPEKVGAPTNQLLTCKGLKIGTTLIELKYMRPFGAKKTEKLCQFNLNVTP
jgi:predicted secreted protein